MAEEEPLLTSSVNQDSGGYGSHDNGEHCQHEESPGSRRLSYSVTDDSYPVQEGNLSMFCHLDLSVLTLALKSSP